MNVLVIQNTALDPIGILGEYLIAQGANLSTWLTEQQATPPAGNYAGLVVLGGPMNAHEDDKFPHLGHTVKLIRQFYAEDKPVLGICLGAQLIARAFGKQVYPHRAPEIGFYPLNPVCQNSPVSLGECIGKAKMTEPWLQSCPADLHIMQWHFDTFELPEQAELLMTNSTCDNQVYRIGRSVYGFQCHLEITPDIVMGWLAKNSDWLENHDPDLGQRVRTQLRAHAVQSAQFAQQIAQFWISLVKSSADIKAPAAISL